ncbi:hypothetical protein F1188_11185 [Roseospira marina]|uniref:Uncharacterized protein n=1 Tax=Roseospira marina TaxID=140057 RepID=A0A5M6IAY1_9PROT|nr:hypothetical protein [Roseospira marina]KAA5605454.1 hypothetical protein F1188_11185 [Roseospira marina]MBB4314546.1 hypothetical protein [Roseospira marina]MBB5088892.1 hypothetical protein [Roseospira marina]
MHVYQEFITIEGAACVELAANVYYTFRRGFRGDCTDPPEPDSCEVSRIEIECDGKRLPHAVEAWFANRIEADEEALQAELLRDHAGGIEDAADARREAAA